MRRLRRRLAVIHHPLQQALLRAHVGLWPPPLLLILEIPTAHPPVDVVFGVAGTVLGALLGG